MKESAVFFVAELVDPNTGMPFAPAVYWNGCTRPGFDAVTTLSINESEKFRDSASCQESISKLAPSKRGIFIPIAHSWIDGS